MNDATKPARVEELPGKKSKKKRTDNIPVAPARPPGQAAIPAAPARPPADVPVAPARPPASLEATTEKSFTPGPEPAQVPPAPATSSANESEHDPDEVTDFGLIVALSSVALVGAAVLATLFPFGRFIAAALAGLGLLGGIASLGAEGRARAVGGAAIAVHTLLLAVILIFPSWLNLDSWSALIIADAPPAPQAYSHAKQTTTLAQWVDAASASWQFRDVRVTICSATVGPIELRDAKNNKRQSKEQYLQLVVRVANIGVERPLELTGWAVGDNSEQVHLTDSAGRTIGPPVFEEGWSPELPPVKPAQRVFPGHSSDVRLLFAAPHARIDFIKVSLPGTTFGFEEEIKFQIDSGSIVLIAPKKK